MIYGLKTKLKALLSRRYVTKVRVVLDSHIYSTFSHKEGELPLYINPGANQWKVYYLKVYYRNIFGIENWEYYSEPKDDEPDDIAWSTENFLEAKHKAYLVYADGCHHRHNDIFITEVIG